MTRVLMGRCRTRKLDDENFAGVGVDREMVELGGCGARRGGSTEVVCT